MYQHSEEYPHHTNGEETVKIRVYFDILSQYILFMHMKGIPKFLFMPWLVFLCSIAGLKVQMGTRK